MLQTLMSLNKKCHEGIYVRKWISIHQLESATCTYMDPLPLIFDK